MEFKKYYDALTPIKKKELAEKLKTERQRRLQEATENRELNELADQQEHGQITKRINGGTIGLDDRIAKTTKAAQALG